MSREHIYKAKRANWKGLEEKTYYVPKTRKILSEITA